MGDDKSWINLKVEGADERKKCCFDSGSYSDEMAARKGSQPTYSATANRQPMQARGPDRNVATFPKAEGISIAEAGTLEKRSGLEEIV